MGASVEKTFSERGNAEPEDFSLAFGGPLYELLLRYKLIDPQLRHLGRRIGVVTAIAWAPPLALTILAGSFAGKVTVPFLYNIEAQARMLFALPMLLITEIAVYVHMRGLTSQFTERQIVTEAVRPAFNAIVSSAIRLRNSLAAEIILLAVIVFAGSEISRASLGLHSDTWYATTGSAGRRLTAAGYWYAFVSIPIVQFLLLRWYYRIAIWCRFLFQVSRLDLNLVALHPDRCCGLGFLGVLVFSFAPLLMAHSGIVAGFIADRIVRQGATLPDYRFELACLAILLLALVLGPLCVFTPRLIRARLAGLRTYGVLASSYVVDFKNKWAQGANSGSEPLLGSADIQSLADLANSFAIVQGVKPLPVDRNTIIRLLVVIAIPLLPLVFTMFSPHELVKRLLSILL